MKIFVINGPNLNMLGIREPNIYGNQTYKALENLIKEHCSSKLIEVEIYQSNCEGEIVNYIQQAYFEKADGIVLNPAGYTHTSVAILDAIKSVNLPCVEVHISKVDEREEFRKISYVRSACVKTISGQGLNGYLQAIDYLIESKK